MDGMDNIPLSIYRYSMDDLTIYILLYHTTDGAWM